MKQHLTRMNALLKAGLEGVGVHDRRVRYDQAERAFLLGDSGIAIALETPSSGAARWRVREVYLFADLEEGGEHPVGGTIEEVALGREMLAAKIAIMRMIERRIDGALDSVA